MGTARLGTNPFRERTFVLTSAISRKNKRREKSRAEWLRTYSLGTHRVKANRGKNRPKSTDSPENANSEWRMANRQDSPFATPHSYSPPETKGFPRRCSRNSTRGK